MKQIKIILFLVFVGIESLFATEQFGDILIINGDTTGFKPYPLEEYFSKKGNRTIGKIQMEGRCSALLRGYVATWKLENDSLFLIRIQTDYCGKNKQDINIKEEFGTDKVFAQWVNTTIILPQGKLLQYGYYGYVYIFEGEKYIAFKQGKSIDIKEATFLKKNDNLLFPGEFFLRDTIKAIILKSIDEIERDSLIENESSVLIIRFNRGRKISHIGFEQEPKNINEEIILRNAKEALENFPKLMKVSHRRYRPPRVHIIFKSHCLKYPNDIEYGCDNK